jgi:hypothetical protein
MASGRVSTSDRLVARHVPGRLSATKQCLLLLNLSLLYLHPLVLHQLVEEGLHLSENSAHGLDLRARWRDPIFKCRRKPELSRNLRPRAFTSDLRYVNRRGKICQASFAL